MCRCGQAQKKDVQARPNLDILITEGELFDNYFTRWRLKRQYDFYEDNMNFLPPGSGRPTKSDEGVATRGDALYKGFRRMVPPMLTDWKGLQATTLP